MVLAPLIQEEVLSIERVFKLIGAYFEVLADEVPWCGICVDV